MAKIDFDVPDGPEVKFGSIDFDHMLPDEIADELGLHTSATEALKALTLKMSQSAHDQKTLNKLVATGVVLAERIISNGGGVNELIDALT